MKTKSPGVIKRFLLLQTKKNVSDEKASAQLQLPPDKMQQLLNELRAHEAELETQNEELRRTQQELESSRAHCLDLYDQVPVGYLTLSNRGLIQEANLTATKMLGTPHSTLLNRPFSNHVFGEDLASYHRLRKTLQETGTPHSLDLRMLQTGGSTFWVHLQATPSENGGCRITLDDITEIWQARQEMLKTQKLESLGILAGGIAHDFNNILTAVLGNISLAQLYLNNPGQAKERLEDAETAVARAQNLAKQLLTFARGGEPVKKIIQINNVLKEATGFALLGSNAKCRFALAEDLLPVEADEGQIVQVIHNLIINAVHAMPEGGTVTVSSENTAARQNGRKFIRISISDSGSGIPKEHLNKIFDPYFTTKSHGSGLGLATCFSIIKKHSGKIRASSTLGKGSTFTISLPASEQACLPDADSRAAIYQGSGHILVMDDERMIRDISKALLERIGYTVDCARNGSEAIELFRTMKERNTPFAAVILDLTIPGEIGGQEVIRQLQQIEPDVKSIACSGYSNSQVMSHYRDYGFSSVLGKPFRLEDLSKALHDLLKH